MIVVVVVIEPGIAKLGYLLNVLRTGSMLGIIAVGTLLRI